MKKVLSILFCLVCLGINMNLKAQLMENGLNDRQRKIAGIATNTAMGDLEALKGELVAGLGVGLTVNEINEVLIQMYAYCGFPRSLQGINTFMAVISERRSEGINDVMGEEPKRVTGENKYEQGKETLEELTRVHERTLSGANAFAPGIDVFLKEHLFADIFGRGVLSFLDRELATVSALTGMEGVDPMLQSHLNMAMNTGFTESQLREVIVTLRPFVGAQKADNAGRLLTLVVENRK